MVSFSSFQSYFFFIECSLKDLQNFFLQSFPLSTSLLFSITSNFHSVDIENPQGICSTTFVVDDFLELFLHPSIF